MNPNQQPEGSGPIVPGSPLARALDDFAVPGLSAGFADRVLAAAEARPAPLPAMRRASAGRRLRLGRRLAIGVASFGALATAAAATGLLQQLAIPVPSAQTVWASITGKELAAAAVAVVPAAAKPAASDPVALVPVKIVGPIDTPEELGEAFRRIDEVRQGRRETRRELTDQRIDRAIERRRAAGLPVPTPEEEARLRQRIEETQSRRQQITDERVRFRREEMARKVESGEALDRENVLRPLRQDGRALQQRERLEQLRGMTPAERREALRQLPPDQRRALMEEFRARRTKRAVTGPVPAPEAAPDAEAGLPEAQPAPAGE